jgi:hypothetical protein
VGEVLEQHKSKLEDPEATQKLAEFFSKNAYKGFAILATNRRFDLMEHFFRNGFHNDMLPVQKRKLEAPNKGSKIESCNEGDFDDKKVCEVFPWGGSSPWSSDPYFVNQFCEVWQWPFVAPVFVKNKFRYTFPPETRLPFTRIGKRKNSDLSFYSYVEETSVHLGHFPNDLVR